MSPPPAPADAGPVEPAPPEPLRPASATRGSSAPRASARSRRRAPQTWRDRMLGEVFFFLLGLGVWLSNASFTVLGVTAPVGLTPLTGLLGFLFHVLLSRAELSLWYRWRDPWYLLLLVGCVLVDAGTTLVGLLPLAATWLPGLVGTTPQNVLDWGHLVTALGGTTSVPAWWPNALLLVAMSFAFALGSERLLRRFSRGMVETWQERPG
ncbi:hypothetical protein [Candidatus Chloroploca asiatica]|nr:hypothetical protein [Candidatus Chloroploca asiatica]